MSKNTKSVSKTTRQTAEALISALHEAGGSLMAIKQDERYIKRFLTFIEMKKWNNQPFNSSFIDKYLRSINVPSLDSTGDIGCSAKRIRSTMRKLINFHIEGVFVRVRPGTPNVIPKCFQTVYNQYIQYRIEEKTLAPRTMRLAVREISRFFCYLKERKIKSVSNIQAEHVDTYFKRYARLAPTTITSRAYNTRELFRFFILRGLMNPHLLTVIPHFRYIKHSRLPDVWSEESVNKLLAVIDTGSPVGKRDYAICLLAAKLGLRVGDIRELCLNHINWNTSTITIVQAKTKKTLILPLPEDIGLALIDYLKNGRPKTKDHHIFVLHNSPFCQFGKNNNFYHVIEKYRRLAEITIPKECRRGFHSLRHTIATRLYEAEVPITAIASLLGHSSVITTRGYARVSVELLRKAALEWEEDDE